MKKYRIILTKEGGIYISHKYSHESLIDKYQVHGRDWHDWVRIVISAEGKIQVKGKHDMPEWLEREYGYYMRKVKEYLGYYKGPGG